MYLFANERNSRMFSNQWEAPILNSEKKGLMYYLYSIILFKWSITTNIRNLFNYWPISFNYIEANEKINSKQYEIRLLLGCDRAATVPAPPLSRSVGRPRGAEEDWGRHSDSSSSIALQTSGLMILIIRWFCINFFLHQF